MSSDDNSETQRAPSGIPRPFNPSSRGALTQLAPILPPLRSSNARRPSTMSASTNPNTSSRSRAPDRPSIRFFNPAEDWSDTDPDFLNEQEYLTLGQHRFSSPLDLWEDDYNSPGFHPNTDFDMGDGPFSFRLLQDHPLPRASSHRPEPPEDSRGAKRRKLDSDRLASNFRGFQYGRYGQVQPGYLKMELVSCDGGLYSDDTTKYAAENILKNDNTVYCTEGSRCNIVLRHQGATVFTLTELVIKAPRSDFTSPVQAGMVFVSMTSDHLLNRTVQYQIPHASSRSSLWHPERELSALREERHPNRIASVWYNEDGSTMTRGQMRARRLYNMGLDDENDDAGVAQVPSEIDISPLSFEVIAGGSDGEGDDSNTWPLTDAWPLEPAPDRIGQLPFESDSSDDDDADDPSINELDFPPARRRRNRTGTAPVEAQDGAQIAAHEAVRAVGELPLTPQAQFYIEPHKSNKCTIRFDPPLSGRFILLKMWNPRRNSHTNIDIQAVLAKGFAGPRFFPALDYR